jgi:hypothetical protein
VTLDIVIPALRPETVERLLRSLALGRDRPDSVSLAGNEIPVDMPSYGLPVRHLRFSSDMYPIGDCDVALHRNVGVWSSECSHVVFLDDDLVAPIGLVAAARRLFEREPFFWGHHRYVDVESWAIEELVSLRPESGAARESPPNSWHLWMSCYGGLFGARRDVLVDAGGFDLGFSGRCGSEDQAFGKRLADRFGHRGRAFIHEPPFAWHTTNPRGVPPRTVANICVDGHRQIEIEVGEAHAEGCETCPWFRVSDLTALLADAPLVPFDPGVVAVRAEYRRGE